MSTTDSYARSFPSISLFPYLRDPTKREAVAEREREREKDGNMEFISQLNQSTHRRTANYI